MFILWGSNIIGMPLYYWSVSIIHFLNLSTVWVIQFVYFFGKSMVELDVAMDVCSFFRSCMLEECFPPWFPKDLVHFLFPGILQFSEHPLLSFQKSGGWLELYAARLCCNFSAKKLYFCVTFNIQCLCNELVLVNSW